MVSCPSLTGQVSCLHKTAVALTGIACVQAGVGFETSDVVGCGIIEAVRAIQLAKFIASDATNVLLVDDDLAWQPATVLKLLTSGNSFVGAAYPRRAGDGSQFCVRTLEHRGLAEYHPKSGLLKVEAVGTGFLMVSREAVLAMFRAYPELKIDDWNVARSERPHLYDLFKDLYYDDPELEFGGRRRDGEDFSFCHRWRAIGGAVWVDPHAEMVHGNRTAQTKGCLWEQIKDDVAAAMGEAA